MFERISVAGFLLIMITLISSTGVAGDIVLDNGQISLTFDEATFVLKQLEGEGARYTFDPDRTPLWAITFLDTALAWVDGSDLQRIGSGALALRSYELSDSSGGRKLTLKWPNIELFGTGTLSIIVEVYLPQGESESYWRISVLNTSNRVALFSLDFPYFSIDPDYSGGRLDALAYPSHAGALFSNPADSANIALSQSMDVDPERMNFTQTYPGAVSMQFFHLYDRSNARGLFCTPLDMAGFLKRYNLRGRGDFIECFIRQYPENNHLPSHHYRQPYDFLIRPLAGDWIDGAKFYRELIRDAPWMSEGDLRSRKNGNGTASVQPIALIMEWNDFSQDADLALDIVTEYRDFFGEKVGIGVHLRWWWDAYLYNGAISSDLVQFIAALRDSSIRIVPYSSTRDWRESMWPDPRAEEAVALNINGVPYHDSTFHAYIMDPASEAWRDLYVSKVTELLQTEGATDIYMDNHPIPRLCYQPDHGHPLGGGTYWIDGYKSICTQIRSQNPGALLTNESRSELLLPWLDFFPASYWASGQWDGPFAPIGAVPIPLVACTYHDFVGFTGSTSHPWSGYGRYQFNFQNGYSFVNGNRLSLLVEPEHIEDFPLKKRLNWHYVWKLTKYIAFASDFLSYGEWMRPPTLRGFPTVEVEFPASFPSMYQRLTTPSVLAGAFRAKNGRLGFALTNFTDSLASGTISIHLSDYGIPAGRYRLYEMGMWGDVSLIDSISGDYYETELQMAPISAKFFIVTSEPGCTKGDVNSDGEINVFDVVLTVNITLEIYDPTPEEWCAADFNTDGSIDLVDILSIVDVILGVEP
ncbi:MAG: DUF6259 domain-containing protein [bacterium]